MNQNGNNSHSIKHILLQCLIQVDDQERELGVTVEMRLLAEHWCCIGDSSIREEAEQEDLVFWKCHVIFLKLVHRENCQYTIFLFFQ